MLRIHHTFWFLQYICRQLTHFKQMMAHTMTYMKNFTVPIEGAGLLDVYRSKFDTRRLTYLRTGPIIMRPIKVLLCIACINIGLTID